MPVSEKIQKVLARQGLGSRREIETWLTAGRITVNGKLAVLGDRIVLADQLTLDGKLVPLLPALQQTRLLCYNKPLGEVATRSDPQNRSTVFDNLPPLKQSRWVMVGRLDLNSEGLLLFTNDGELAHQLMHPRYEMEREYAVRVMGKLTPAMMQCLCSGVELEDGVARFKTIRKMNRHQSGVNQWYRVILAEGRYREVRRLFESQGCVVSRLIRTRYGAIKLPKDLPKGHWIELPATMIQQFYNKKT
jgi:23S rRNA pseudouridine2605 synthase